MLLQSASSYLAWSITSVMRPRPDEDTSLIPCPQWMNECYLFTVSGNSTKPSFYHPDKNPLGQIFNIGDIVSMAGGNYTSLAIKGGVIGIRSGQSDWVLATVSVNDFLTWILTIPPIIHYPSLFLYFRITWNCDLDWDFDKYCKTRSEMSR